ncbi:MAG: restriction endonuclease subunit S [Thiotrichaceae bacterium]|nr:restriction endonuclease subunit S [Thiotrichaceae bacterium]
MVGKYQAYPEYKDSGVEWLGEVPAHWMLTRIKYVSELTPKKPLVRRDLQCSFIPMEKLKTDSIILDEIRVIDDVYDGYTYFENSDVLMAKVTPCFENKNIAVAKGLVNGIGFGSSEIYVLRVNERVSNKFLYYRLQEDSFMDIATAAMTGAGGLKRVPSEVVNNYMASLPAVSEQKIIANFLDHETTKIDTLIEKQQQLIQLLKEKRQAVISHAVTKGLNPDAPMRESGVEWLGDVPEHWIVAQLKFNTLEMQTGPFGSQLHAGDYVIDGIPLINPAHMIAGEIVPDSKVSVDKETQERLERHKLCEGDLIFARRGELGRCAVITKEQEGWLCGTGSLKAKLNERLLPEYSYLLITSDGVVSELSLESKGSTMDNLNTETLGRVRVPVPPEDEQEGILTYVHDVAGKYKALIGKATDQVTLLQERRTALISAAVTGKIDVRNWTASDQTQSNKEDVA